MGVLFFKKQYLHSIFGCWMLFFLSQSLNAADRYWIASGPSNWNNTANWSNAAAGGGGFSVPGANDRAYFTANGLGACNLDIDVIVAHFEFQSGFTGIFNQNTSTLTVRPAAITGATGMMIYDGQFNGGNRNILLDQFIITPPSVYTVAHFVLDGGATFISTSANFIIWGNYSHLSGTFNHNGGWVSFRGNLSGSKSITGTSIFNKVDFKSASNPTVNSFGIVNSITILDTMSKTGASQNRITGGDLFLKGDVVINYVGWTGGTPWGGARFYFDGAGDQNFDGGTCATCWVENIYIDKPSGTLFLHNTIRVGPDWIYNAGNLDAGVSNVYCYGTGNAALSGTHTLYNLIIRGFVNGHRRIIPLTDVVTVANTLTYGGDNYAGVYGGQVHVKGDVRVPDFSPDVALNGASGTIVFNGTGNQLLESLTTTLNKGFLPNIVIDKPSGTLTMIGNIVVERSWNYIRGDVDAVTNNSYVRFRSNADIIDGQGISSTMLFYDVELFGVNRPLGGDLRVKNRMILNNNILSLNTYDLFIENSSPVSIERTTGTIISETTPATDLGKVHWFIDNAPNGTSFLFPFSTAVSGGTYIPYTLTVQNPGSSPSVGVVSLATYPTITTVNPNNRPFPPGVTNLNNFAGSENATKELDRYWVYECNNYDTNPTVDMEFTYLNSEWSTGNNNITESLLRPHQWNPATQVWDQPLPGSSINTVDNKATVSGVTVCSPFTLVDPSLPDLLFSASDTVLCVGDAVVFTDENTATPLSREWFFPGGTPATSTDASPVITYNTPGTYDAILWSTYPGGVLKDTLFNYIKVNPGITVTSTVTNVACNGGNTGAISLDLTGGSGVYTYSWSPGGFTTKDITGLTATTYNVTVTDTSGCVRTTSEDVTQPPALTASISGVQNALCSGDCNGQATVNPSGGAGGFSYEWGNGETTQTALALCPGNQSVIVTDANGCTVSQNTNITGPAALTVTIGSVTNVACHGNCTGSATATAGGGQGTYTYAWSNGQSTATATALCAGWATVTVTDQNNCTKVDSVEIIQPTAIALMITKTDILCNGDNNGTATVTPSGGAGSYTYSWTAGGPPTNQATVNNLPPGSVTVTVADLNSCTSTASATITQPAVLAATTAKQDVSCFTGTNGKAWVVTASGGIPAAGGYVYSWSDGTPPLNTDTTFGLSAGNVTVTVSDSNGCSVTSSQTINQPTALSLTVTKTEVSCFNGSDGVARVSISGGILNYSPVWDRGDDMADSTVNLTAGPVSVTVTDGNGCTATSNITINEPVVLTIVMDSTNVSCGGAADGEASVTPSGGNGGYTYLWTNNETTQSVTGLSQGSSCVTVTDSKGCEADGCVNISEIPGITLVLTQVNITCFGDDNGSATVTASDGAGSYTYLWSNGNPTNQTAVSNLPPGKTYITVTDASLCSVTDSVDILEPAELVVSITGDDISCNGLNDGRAKANITGGTVSGNYTINWTTTGTVVAPDSVSGIPPGPVSVVVSDDNGCSANANTTISEPLTLTLVMDKNDVSCNGVCDGEAWVNASGGTGTYNYTWSDGVPNSVGDSVTALCAGTVSVTVEDANGCVATESINLIAPAAITLSMTKTDITCNGLSNGRAGVTATGGDGNYTYVWDANGGAQLPPGDSIINLGPGPAIVTVEDGNGCTESASVVINQPAPLVVTLTQYDISCNGEDDGRVKAVTSGGTPGYLYFWNPFGVGTVIGAAQDSIINLPPGNISVAVRDVNNCTDTADVTITEPAVINLVLDKIDVTCNGGDDGQAWVIASGGTPIVGPEPYTYLWDAGTNPTNDSITDLLPGLVTVIVTDGSNCSESGSISIGEPAPMSLTMSKTDLTCFGSNNGTAAVVVAGGNPPYNYQWNVPSISTDTIDNLSAGTYTVVVTDSLGCSATDSITVNEPSAIFMNASFNPVTCPDGNDGLIDLSVSGGTGNYTYLWSNGSVSQDLNGIAEGFYSVIVSDDDNCTATASFTIQVGTRFEISANTVNAACGVNDGVIDLTVLSGTGTYSYAWTGGLPAVEDHNNVEAGTYSVTVTDLGTNCEQSLAVVVENTGRPNVTGLTFDATDCTIQDGSIELLVTGGSGLYSYNWSNGNTNQNNTGLSFGSYTVTVTDDSFSCIAINTFELFAVNGITLNGVVTDATCGASNGSITLSVLNGTAPYTFLWSTGAVTQNLTVVGLGTYSVTVNDAGNCSGTEVFTVNESGPQVTAVVNDVSCNSYSNGSIILTVSGGSGNYSYFWSNGINIKDNTFLSPGLFSVTVTDVSNQCSTAEIFNIVEPLALTMNADRFNISCHGEDDGSINLFVSGGASPYTFMWTGPSGFSSNDNNITQLAPGDYEVMVLDDNTCESFLSVTIEEPAPMILTLGNTDVSCGGEADGSAWVIVSGGASPFSYLWSRGFPDDVDSVTGLIAGAIEVTVTDANGCSATGSLTINEPQPLILTVVKTDISCNGLNDGVAWAEVSGGTPNYTYVWNGGIPVGIFGDTVTALTFGFVTVIVTDDNACSKTDSIEIIEPLELTTVISGVDISCFGGSDGSASVTASGGTLSYTYQWSAGTNPTTPDVTELLADVVYVTVTDARDCIAVDSITINEPSPITLVMDSNNIFCNGIADGKAWVTVSGGTPSTPGQDGYTYNWDFGTPVGIGDTVINLDAGVVTVIVADSRACEATESVEITEPTPIVLTINSLNISCFGANDGEAWVEATGGLPGNVVPYTYLWDKGFPNDEDTVRGLDAGLVTVTVADIANCTATASVDILEPNEIFLTITKSDITCFGLTNGEATVSASGGTPGFTYEWSVPDTLPGGVTAVNLGAGIVSVTVTDSRLCSDSISIDIIEPVELILAISQTDVSCFNGNDGTAKVVATGGTPSQPGAAGYTYQWTDGTTIAPNDSVHSLLAGTVVVTVTDARGCSDTISATLTQPATALTIDVIDKTDISCFNGNDGTAWVEVSGGTPAYTYNWTRGIPGLTPDTTTQLTAGSVDITVADANNCTATSTITILQPDELILTIAVDSNASCNAGADGGLTVRLTGGTADYTYTWSHGPSTPGSSLTANTVAGLTVGNYEVTVTDANNCTEQISAVITERPGPQQTAAPDIQRPSCNQNDGSIMVNFISNDLPVTYSWSHNTALNSPMATLLIENTYSVTITDRSTCDTVLTFILTDIPGPEVEFIKIKDSYCDDNDGQATAILTGGNPPYSFEWVLNNVTISNDSIITGLSADLYSLIVGDALGCDTQFNFTIFNIGSPEVEILTPTPQTIFPGQTVEMFTAVSIPTVTYEWTPATNITCTDCSAPVGSPTTTTTYRLIVVDTTTLCVDTAYMTIVVKDEKNFFVPNVITPNGDGINDTWRIVELQEVFPDHELVIVNRWGDEVFRAKNYNNDWGGTYNGKKLPDGTYYYIIKLNNISKSLTGHVTIISE